MNTGDMISINEPPGSNIMPKPPKPRPRKKAAKAKNGGRSKNGHGKRHK